MRRTVFALLGTFMLVALALSGGAAQAGNYGGGVVVGGGYVGGAYIGGGGYYGPGRRRCCGCPRGLFTGCGGYYRHPPVRYVVPAEPPPYYGEPRRHCPKVPVQDGRGGWVWGPNAACY